MRILSLFARFVLRAVFLGWSLSQEAKNEILELPVFPPLPLPTSAPAYKLFELSAQVDKA